VLLDDRCRSLSGTSRRDEFPEPTGVSCYSSSFGSGGFLHTLTFVHGGLPIRNVTLTSRSVTNDRLCCRSVLANPNGRSFTSKGQVSGGGRLASRNGPHLAVAWIGTLATVYVGRLRWICCVDAGLTSSLTFPIALSKSQVTTSRWQPSPLPAVLVLDCVMGHSRFAEGPPCRAVGSRPRGRSTDCSRRALLLRQAVVGARNGVDQPRTRSPGDRTGRSTRYTAATQRLVHTVRDDDRLT